MKTQKKHTERGAERVTDRQAGRRGETERERGPFDSSVGDSFNMDPFVFD